MTMAVEMDDARLLGERFGSDPSGRHLACDKLLEQQRPPSQHAGRGFEPGGNEVGDSTPERQQG